MTPFVSVIVPTFRRPDQLRECLRALIAQTYDHSRYEIVVVDDDAPDERAQVELPDHDHVSITAIGQPRLGVAAGRNRGARTAIGELLLFVDDDVIVAEDHIVRHQRRQAELGPRTLLNGVWQFTPAVIERLRSTPFGRFRLELNASYQSDQPASSAAEPLAANPHLSAHDFSLPKELFWELGGFDESMPSAGAEDQDLSIRALAAGCRILIDNSIRTLHNDDRDDFRAFCAREERAAANMPYMARKYPASYARNSYFIENTPPRRGDAHSLVIKKLIKRGLATGPALIALHRSIKLIESRAEPPDVLLRRCYSAALAAHIYRGFDAGVRRIATAGD